jgi:hypothetical protein
MSSPNVLTEELGLQSAARQIRLSFFRAGYPSRFPKYFRARRSHHDAKSADHQHHRQSPEWCDHLFLMRGVKERLIIGMQCRQMPRGKESRNFAFECVPDSEFKQSQLLFRLRSGSTDNSDCFRLGKRPMISAAKLS